MNQETIENLKELNKSIAYFQSLHPDEQKMLWPLLGKSVQSTIELLEAISEQPRTYAELAEITEYHPNTVSQKLNALSEFFNIQLGSNKAYAPPSKEGGRMRRLARKTLV
jgi:predicted transcriptional regulator